MPTAETNLQELQSDTDLDPEQNADQLEMRPGFPPEPPETPTAPRRGGDANATDAQPPAPAEVTPAIKPVKPTYLVPREHWPDYPCTEHGGKGWEVSIVSKKGEWSL